MAHYLIGLVATTPAVITDALWGLAFQLDEPVTIDSVELVSTQGTMHHLRELLQNHGQLAQLKEHYPREMPWE